MFTNNVEKVPEFEFKTVETVIHKSQIYTRPPPPPPPKKNLGWENGEPWLSRGFILDIGGVGVCCPILFCPRMKKVLDLSLSFGDHEARLFSDFLWFLLKFISDRISPFRDFFFSYY